MPAILHRIRTFRLTGNRKMRGQSFIELAIILPVLLLLLLGMVEVVAFISAYLDILDLTREAARFASVRDPFTRVNSTAWTCGPGTNLPFDYYYNTACIFTPPWGQPCPGGNDKFCNGLNTYAEFDPATDDIVITVFSTTKWSAGAHTTKAGRTCANANGYCVSDTHPTSSPGTWQQHFWAFSDNDPDTAHNANWSKDCEDPASVVRSAPYYTQERINTELRTSSSTANKGFVAVELYYCYDQVLSLPLVTQFIPDPLRIHAYTLMPVPAAQPTPTPVGW